MPLPDPGDLPDPEIKPRSPALQAVYLLFEPSGKPCTAPPTHTQASLVVLVVKNPTTNEETQETHIQSLGWEDPLEEDIATNGSILAWKIPRTEEPGRLQSMGSQRVRHD